MSESLKSTCENATLKSVREQADGIESDCERCAIRAELVSAKWDRRNLWLGLASTITAAAAAFVVGGDKQTMLKALSAHANLAGSLLALTSSILASTLTFLAPSKRAESFHAAANKYLALRERLRQFRKSVASEEPKASTNGNPGSAADPSPRKLLEGFVAEKRDIDVGHPIIPEWAYQKAQRRLIEKRIRKRQLKRFKDALEAKDLNNSAGDDQLLDIDDYVPQTRWQELLNVLKYSRDQRKRLRSSK